MGKRVDHTVSTLLTPVSLYFVVWRRPETGDRSEIGIRQRIFLPYVSQHIRSVKYRTATHMVYSTQAQHNSVAQLVYALLWTTPADSTLPTNFTAGCAKVNCPKGKRRSSGGYPCRATRWLVITDGTYEYNPLISFNNYP